MTLNEQKNIPPELLEEWGGRRFYSFGRFLRQHFNKKVFKIGIDGGFTCPNRDGTRGDGGCIYCENESFRAGSLLSEEDIALQVKNGISYRHKKYEAEKYIVYFQNFSNTYGPVDRLAALYNQALDHEDVVGIAISTRPDCLGRDVLDLLEEIHTKSHLWVELGLQSANDQVLKRINRGNTRNEFGEAVGQLKKRGIRTCAHVILGLPGESRSSMFDSASLLNELRVEGVKLHQLLIVPGTELAHMYEKGEVECFSMEDYLELTAEYLARLSPEIVIHRLFGVANNKNVLAPRWNKSKMAMTQTIDAYLKTSGRWQGELFKG